jgi:hypothetical protein
MKSFRHFGLMIAVFWFAAMVVVPMLPQQERAMAITRA